MSDWSTIFGHALALIAAEPVPLQFTFVIVAAFCAVMILEGMRLTFVPRRQMIRYLQLHAPEEMADNSRVSQSYEAEDFAVSFAQSAPASDGAKPVFRSAGSLRPTIRRTPRDLLEASRDD